jgi:hypothetical protein
MAAQGEIASKTYVDSIVDALEYQAPCATADAGKIPVIGASAGTWGVARGIDSAPAASSVNLITSGAVKTAVDGVFVEKLTESDAQAYSAANPNVLVWVGI